MAPRRHDWAYVRTGAMPALGGADASARAWIVAHVERGGPLVVTRQHASDGIVALGAVLPSSHGRVRIACTIAESDVERVRGPITFDEAATVLSARDVAALARLAAAVAGHALAPGIYGSTAWEFVTGERYRHPQSDIDVIFDVATRSGFGACLAAFEDAARVAASRIDGEIRLAGGSAVAWRELHDACGGGPAVVLVKSARDVALLSLHQVLAQLR